MCQIHNCIPKMYWHILFACCVEFEFCQKWLNLQVPIEQLEWTTCTCTHHTAAWLLLWIPTPTRPQTSFFGERYTYSDQSVECLPPSLISHRYGYAKWEAERVITVWPTCNWLLIDPQELNWKRPLTEEGPLFWTTLSKLFVIFLPIVVVHV